MKAAVKHNKDRPSTSSRALSSPLDALELPLQVKESMRMKANDLANDETAIVQAPGDECAWMVRSYHGKRPHYVRVSKSSFSCDEQCLSYKSMKVCSHTLAIAMKTDSVKEFVKAYCSRNLVLLHLLKPESHMQQERSRNEREYLRKVGLK